MEGLNKNPGADVLLSVDKLSVQFQSGKITTSAVKDISFEVLKGEILGIVGESGSGKSVTALSLNQLIRSIPNAHQEGAITLNNISPINLSTIHNQALQKIRGKVISMIFQEPMTSLNPVFRCGDQIEEVLEVHETLSKIERKEKVIDLLRKVQIEDAERIYASYPNEISGGQKQRVMIAMAMACKPQLLIADEPTTALDVTIQRSIIDLMKALQKESGMAIIFISHDLNLVAEIADRVIVMKDGQIVEQGSVANIFQHPKEPYTMGLLASRPPMDIQLSRLPTMKDFEREGGMEQLELEAVLDQFRKDHKEKKEEEKPVLLSVEDLKVWFPIRKNWLTPQQSFVKAVDGVSFVLKKGEILGLVGESGSGKTTIGRSLVRLVEPSSGQVFFDGQNICDLNRSALKKMRRRIQIIFQDPYSSLNPRMSVGNAIMEPLWVHGHIRNKTEGEQEVRRLLSLVGLEDGHYNRFPNEFSGGQRQRIGIARALAAKPDMLICDESVASLDVSIQAQILNLLKDLKEKQGLSILFISHDLSVIKFLSERILVMKDGILVEQGLSNEIYHHAKEAYTKKLLQAIPMSRKGIF